MERSHFRFTLPRSTRRFHRNLCRISTSSPCIRKHWRVRELWRNCRHFQFFLCLAALDHLRRGSRLLNYPPRHRPDVHQDHSRDHSAASGPAFRRLRCLPLVRFRNHFLLFSRVVLIWGFFLNSPGSRRCGREPSSSPFSPFSRLSLTLE